MIMVWEIEYTDEFDGWWHSLSEGEQDAVASSVLLLEQYGPNLGFPHSSGISGSKYGHLRELRVQHKGAPYRVLYAFDPRRLALLLIGGNKRGDDRWYDTYVPLADKLYEEHLKFLEKEGLL
jgi:hypothetical protein